MIDVVYLYKAGPAAWQELRYSLRSLETNLKLPHRVVLVSDELPTWIKNVALLPVAFNGGSRYADVTRKIEHIASCELISDRLLFMYDDIYLLSPVTDPFLFEINRYQVQLSKQVDPLVQNWYKMLVRTLDWLKAKGYPQYNFETHMPRYVNRKTLKLLLREIPVLARNMQRWTAFGNCIQKKSHSAPGDVMQVKAGFYGYSGSYSSASNTRADIEAACQGKMVLNHNDKGLTPELIKYLEHRFPNPSKYEHS